MSAAELCKRPLRVASWHRNELGQLGRCVGSMQARSSFVRKVQNSVIGGPENSKLSDQRVQNLMIHLRVSACYAVMRSS